MNAGKIRKVKNIYRSIFTILFLCITIGPANAQEREAEDGMGNKSKYKTSGTLLEKTEDVLENTEDFIENYLDKKDSIYISPNLYNMTIMPQYSYAYEYYRFSTGDKKQRITMSPSSRNRIGLYVGWRWIFLGYSIDLEEGSPQSDINFSFYTSKIGIDLFYRKRTEGYKIRRIDGFSVGGQEITEYNHNFDGLTVKQKGLNLYYVFNNKKFSYPAAYSQSTNQRISCGSFIMGVSYSRQSFHLDASKFDCNIREAMTPSMNFNRVKYTDISINAGYSYNWVFAKNYLANISITPAIGYKHSKIKTDEDRSILNNINADLVSRAAIVYNNSRYFVGASIVSHTYTYHRSALSIVNGFGVVNVYTGVNLFRK
jgi:hypothetical protein